MRKPAPLSLLVLATAVSLAGCSSQPELVFADWLIPVAEGTPVKEHAAVPLEGRDDSAIQLIDDLVIGTDLSNPAAVLYEPRGIAVAPDGTIFVADGGTNDIKMFDANGAYVKTLGQEGQGPGEFSFINGLTVAGEQLVVNDSRNRRFSVWTLDGAHVEDYAPTERRSLSSFQGLADGTVVGYFSDRANDGSGERALVRQNLQGEEVSRVLTTPLPALSIGGSREPQAILQRALDTFDDPRTAMSVGSGEVIYVTPLHQYQVFAYSPEGAMLWALRTSWEPFDWNDSAKQGMLRSFESAFQSDEPVRADDLTWPAKYTALVQVANDGRGRVFAFIAPLPGPEFDGSSPPDEWPVDAYSPQGDFLAAGLVPFPWTYARGDYVYGTRPDDNEETVVVRYRLLVNGQ